MFGWFKKKQSSGPDFSSLNSREKAETAARQGDLAPMLLMPEEFGGEPIGPNLVFVPAWAAEQKHRIDMGTILPLAESGKISKYSAQPLTKVTALFLHPSPCARMDRATSPQPLRFGSASGGT